MYVCNGPRLSLGQSNNNENLCIFSPFRDSANNARNFDSMGMDKKREKTKKNQARIDRKRQSDTQDTRDATLDVPNSQRDMFSGTDTGEDESHKEDGESV